MSTFYKANIEFITEHAVSADKRRYVDSTEAPRHFLDADHYGKKPFSKIPQHWEDAVHKYTADTLDIDAHHIHADPPAGYRSDLLRR